MCKRVACLTLCRHEDYIAQKRSDEFLIYCNFWYPLREISWIRICTHLLWKIWDLQMAELTDFMRSKKLIERYTEEGRAENELTIHQSHWNFVGIDFWRSAEIRVGSINRVTRAGNGRGKFPWQNSIWKLKDSQAERIEEVSFFRGRGWERISRLCFSLSRLNSHATKSFA